MSGRGTAGGVVFQAEVGAGVAGLLLAERPLSRLASGLPGRPRKLLFESPAAVDDILIETDTGKIYVQAKRTIVLSPQKGSELASVAEQFVRQFRAGVVEGGVRRALDPARDRLLLMVGDETGATVTNHLREALERSRTGAATAIPDKLASALKTFAEHIDDAWLREAGVAMNEAERQSLLAVCAVAVFAEPQRQLVEECLREVVSAPGDETSLMDLLVMWAANASKSGVGGDVAAIRLAMVGKARLIEPPSFKDDVKRLREYCDDLLKRLQRFTEMPAPEGQFSISRPVADVVVQAARQGSLVITGDPGAGKSAVIHQVTEALKREAPVVTFTVEANAISLDALRREIGLEHSVLDVLKQIPGDKPAYLILDALDAVRGGLAEATYRRLVEDVRKLPGWHVVASVRSFDLRLGQDWRRLFAGSPFANDHADVTLRAVRHVHIGLLNDQEKADIASKSPLLAEAVGAGGPKMEALARNPFNLALIADLMKGGVVASALASVATRGQLLERYWQERISELGLLATVSLKNVVDLMMAGRSIDIPETEVPIATAATVDALQHVGVLVTTTSRRIGFRHHVLFDYAVARLILLPDQSVAFSHLNKARGAGLLIAPSLGYWIEEVKAAIAPQEFWALIARLVTDTDIDPIARIEIARLAVESVGEIENLDPLLPILESPNPSIVRAFGQLVGALLTKAPLKQPIPLGPWAKLLGKMRSPKFEQIDSMRTLTGLLLDAHPNTEALNALGVASRTLFDVTVADENLIEWLASQVIPFVARTFHTEPSASRERLETIFSAERFRRFGHIEVPWLAGEILPVAASDGEFAVQIFYRVFRGGEFRSDQVTSVSSSWILSLKSNAAQNFQRAEYLLTTAYPEVLSAYPEVGVRALAAALRATREKEHPTKEGHAVSSLPFGHEMKTFDEDLSHVWAWDIDGELHSGFVEMAQEFLSWISVVGDNSKLDNVAELVLQETGISLAWRILFDAGTRVPAVLGVKLWASAGAGRALLSLDTRQSAVGMIAATYPYVSEAARREAEDAWLQFDFSECAEPECERVEVLGTLFEAIGKDQLETNDARTFLQRAKSDGRKFENEKPFRTHVISGNIHHWLTLEGVDIEAPEVAPLIQLSNALNVALDATKKDQSADAYSDVWAKTVALGSAMQRGERTLDPMVDQEVSDALSFGLAVSIANAAVPDGERLVAIERLLSLSTHPHPQAHQDTEAKFASFPSWGLPSPRIRAARGLANLISVNGIWPLIQQRIETLVLDDPHPAVRLQILEAITLIRAVDVEAMWSLIDKIVAKETNVEIIQRLARQLALLRELNDARLELIILELAERFPQVGRGDDSIAFLIVHFAVVENREKSNAQLRGWVERFSEKDDRVRAVISGLRAFMTKGFAEYDAVAFSIRERCSALLWLMIEAVEPFMCSWLLRGGEPTDVELKAFKIFDAIGDEIYYAAGHGAELPLFLKQKEARRAFLDKNASLISKLTTLGSPKAVHQLIELVGKLADADPARCFDLFSDAILRTTGVARYEHEFMGASRFVEFVGRYLADYRSIFDDEIRRRKLVDCMALFVEAGWPDARRLFQSLPELIQ